MSDRSPFPPYDLARAVAATEVVFIGDAFGAGVDREIVTGRGDGPRFGDD